MKLLQKINVSWRKIRRRRRLKSVIRIESRDDLPRKLGAAVYIVGGEIPKWVVLECPCRCGQERIDVNLMHARRPCVAPCYEVWQSYAPTFIVGAFGKMRKSLLGQREPDYPGLVAPFSRSGDLRSPARQARYLGTPPAQWCSSKPTLDCAQRTPG